MSYNFDHINEIISRNIKSLILQNNITQKELAELIGIAPATMSDYCNGRRLPSVDFLVSLKALYNISVDDFLTKDVSLVSVPVKSSAYDSEVYSKLFGTYFIYYFDTSKYKGKDEKIPRDALTYGVLNIFETSVTTGAQEPGCIAVLGVKDRNTVDKLYEMISLFHKASDIIGYITKEYPASAYYGEIDATKEHLFINLAHLNTDKASLIFHNVDSNKQMYLGGMGTINSVSKGRERMPVVQFIGLSRYHIDMSEEEIHHALLTQYPEIEVGEDADVMIKEFKAIYCGDDLIYSTFTEYQKSLFFKSILSTYIRKCLERNVFRYGKISEKDDDAWYHAIKQASQTD